MRWIGFVIGALLTLTSIGAAEPTRLRVSDNQKYLVREDGSPFFYLGDTAWELFHRTTREEADVYLADRAAKGFTVIQAVALAEEDGLNTPNSYGHRPLLGNDPARPNVKEGPNNDYWDHVDYVVQRAESRGMHIGLLPTWGDKWNLRWGVGPEVFTPRNARVYGQWLGQRYRDKPIIWILGGDRPIENDRQREIIHAMAEGIEEGDGGRNLMTFHPSGRRNSADDFHSATWLDFNMIQSGHERPATPNFELMLKNLSLQPTKPTLDGEPCYEDHPIKGTIWNRRKEPGVLLEWYDEWNVRVAAYGSMLAGACGHTYGNHNIWQLWLPDRPAKSVARTPWKAALQHPGSQQMKYFRDLFEARPFWKLRSNQALVTSENRNGEVQIRAALAEDRSFALIYFPEGQHATIALNKLAGDSVNGWWFNPRQNSCQLIGQWQKRSEREFHPPTSGRNNDWLLVIDDATQAMPRLGSSYQNIIPVVNK